MPPPPPTQTPHEADGGDTDGDAAQAEPLAPEAEGLISAAPVAVLRALTEGAQPQMGLHEDVALVGHNAPTAGIAPAGSTVGTANPPVVVTAGSDLEVIVVPVGSQVSPHSLFAPTGPLPFHLQPTFEQADFWRRMANM